MEIPKDQDFSKALQKKRSFAEKDTSSQEEPSLKVDMSAIKGNQSKTRVSISLEPDVKDKLKRLAYKNGYNKISTFLNDLIKSIKE